MRGSYPVGIKSFLANEIVTSCWLKVLDFLKCQNLKELYLFFDVKVIEIT